MPSGPKKRRASKRKQGLGIILDKEAKKSQDVSGIKSSTQSVGGDNLVGEATLPAAIADVIRGLEDESGKEDIEVAEQDSELEQKESEVNSFVSVVKNIPDEKSLIPTELKSNEAIQDTLFDESKKHFAEHVFTSDHGSILINKEEAVLNQSKDVDTGENIEDYDSNTRVEDFVGHVHNAGFNFPSAEVGINGTDTSKISTEVFLFKDVVNEESIDQDDDSNIKRENLVDNVNVVSDYPSVFERNNEEFVADSLNNLDCFKIHSENLIEDIHDHNVSNNGTDTSKISTEEFIVVNEESIDQDGDSNIKRENLVDNVNVVSDYSSVLERNNEELVAGSLNNLDSFKIHSENLTEDIHDHNVSNSDLPTSTLPFLPEEFTPRNDTMIPFGPVEEEEQQRMLLHSLDETKFAFAKDPKFLESLGVISVSPDKEPELDYKSAFEIKKNLKLMSELICQSKKNLEEELSAVNKFRDTILKSLDDLNAIQLPQVI